MAIGGIDSASGLYGRGIERGYPFNVGTTSSFAQASLDNRDLESQLRRTLSTLTDLRDTIADIRKLLGVPAFGRSTRLQVVSAANAVSDPIGLDPNGTRSTLTSTEEINTAPTSYDTHTPDFSLGTSVALTVDGAYDGVNGAGELRFVVEQYGQGHTRLRVYEADGSNDDTLDIKKNEDPARTVTLTNGLQLTLTSGTFVDTDTASLQLSTTVGTAVDPDNPFNGVGDDDADLDVGEAVTDGSFQLNGVNISVLASDSITTLLDRINGAGAGATAAFDVATERIVFTADQDGDQPITLSGDTSGVLSALKLDTAVVVPGAESEEDVPIGQLAQFSGVTDGTITVNGQSFGIDKDNDTFNDIVARIDALSTASAVYDGSTLTISSDLGSGTLSLDDNSGFLAAIGISLGQYDPETAEVEGVSRRGYLRPHANRVGDALDDLAGLVNDLFGSQQEGGVSSALDQLRKNLLGGVQTAYDDTGLRLRSRYGPTFDFGRTDGKVFRLSSSDERKIEDHLVRGRDDEVRDLLVGDADDDADGLLDQLDKVAETGVAVIDGRLGTLGRLFDVSA